MRSTLAVALLLASTLAPSNVRAQEKTDPNPFTWSGTIPSGRWITIRNLNGPVHVIRGSSDRVEVTGIKRWHRGDPSVVRFDVSHDGSDVRICALWGERSSCNENSYESHDGSSRNNDVSVEFTVRVPPGVKVNAQTVNSDVSVTGVTSDVKAGTVNGSVSIETEVGAVTGSSVNGSVRATVLHPHTGDMKLESVNGSVIAEFGADIDADVDLRTMNGRFITDFPVTLNGRIDPQHMRATLGKGGSRVTLSSVNGNVELRKH